MNAGLGWTLGDYVIGQPIDSGKFGTVYGATHQPSGREVALKLIPLQGVDGDEKVSAERHGAMLQTAFCQAHRGLVPEVYEHQQIVTFYAIAMEMVRGQQLTDLIAAGPLPPKKAATIAMAICNFLEKAHRFETDIEGVHYQLIVHADLKPDHILLLDTDEIRVLDFGIAKALAARTLVTTNKWGSVHYASPERLQSDGHVNEHVDFWSLGVMLFEMVAGFRPYRQYEHNVSRLDAAIRRQETREALPVTSDPVLGAIISKLLAPQLERRYSSATAISKDLHAFLFGGPVVAAMEMGEAGQETVRINPPSSAAPSAAAVPGAAAAPAAPPVSVADAVSTAAAAIAQAATAAVRRAGDSPATEPLPSAARRAARKAAREAAREARKAAGVTWGKTGMPPIPSLPGSKPRKRHFVGMIWGWIFIGLIATEGIGLIRTARFRAQVDGLESADVSTAREEYRRIAKTPLGIGRALGVRHSLATRMIDLADRSIVGYRMGNSQVAEAQWEQARDCLDLAAEVAPNDQVVAAKRAYVRGQIARINARDQSGIDEAVQAFHDAASLDPTSPDPYLGLARIFAYQMPDVDALTEAIHDAEARGYTSGRRERAQFGDVYKLRADRERTSAMRLTGDERTAELKNAAGDYAKCVEYFQELRFFNSEDNLRTCRRRLDAINAELEPDQQVEPEPATSVEL